MNIYQKLVEIRKSIDVFTKDTKGFNYNYVSGAQILKKIKDKMDEEGVILEQHVLNSEFNKHEYIDSKGKNKIDFIINGNMKMIWVNAENPEDKIEVAWYLFGQQEDISKAYGSGLTYSERYFLLKYFGIPTDEDDPDRKNNVKSSSSNQSTNTNANSNEKASDSQINFIKKLVTSAASKNSVKEEQIEKQMFESLKIKTYEDITKSLADIIIKKLK